MKYCCRYADLPFRSLVCRLRLFDSPGKPSKSFSKISFSFTCTRTLCFKILNHLLLSHCSRSRVIAIVFSLSLGYGSDLIKFPSSRLRHWTPVWRRNERNYWIVERITFLERSGFLIDLVWYRLFVVRNRNQVCRLS